MLSQFVGERLHKTASEEFYQTKEAAVSLPNWMIKGYDLAQKSKGPLVATLQGGIPAGVVAAAKARGVSIGNAAAKAMKSDKIPFSSIPVPKGLNVVNTEEGMKKILGDDLFTNMSIKSILEGDNAAFMGKYGEHQPSLLMPKDLSRFGTVGTHEIGHYLDYEHLKAKDMMDFHEKANKRGKGLIGRIINPKSDATFIAEQKAWDFGEQFAKEKGIALTPGIKDKALATYLHSAKEPRRLAGQALSYGAGTLLKKKWFPNELNKGERMFFDAVSDGVEAGKRVARKGSDMLYKAPDSLL